MNTPKVKKRITPTVIGSLPTAKPVPVAVPKEVEEDIRIPRNKTTKTKVFGRASAIRKLAERNIRSTKNFNVWVHHVKKFAAANNMAYGCALSNPNVKKGYVKGELTPSKNLFKVPSGCSPSAAAAKPAEKKKPKKPSAYNVHVKGLDKIYKKKSGRTYEQYVMHQRNKGRDQFITNLENKYKSINDDRIAF